MLEGEEKLTYVDLIEHNIDSNQDLLKGRHNNEDTITNAHTHWSQISAILQIALYI
jgi:hypothetical protein